VKPFEGVAVKPQVIEPKERLSYQVRRSGAKQASIDIAWGTLRASLLVSLSATPKTSTARA
jgi:hypothetical protein